ncbi:MAG: hypothetical protein AUJ55_06785 [Proteobacteria bacterium CG1_02_64_396]|nr:MAG: hypothetical protein AUJ55_06785 [Proteobacteria bacterium CG1_02_64_396]
MADAPLNAALKYNPHLWGDDELRAIFVARGRELQELTEALQDTPPTKVPQHRLVVGPRGMGKSTLLQRLALAVRDDPNLSAHWLPLIFPEEQYTVRGLDDLWRNTLDALADALEREGGAADELALFDAQIAALAPLESEQREELALAMLTDWIGSHRRGLLLLIDSSDLLLGNLAAGEKSGKKDGSATVLWRLRNTLSHQPGLFWIGASYEHLELHAQYQHAFHDFFHPLELRSLNAEEMRAAILALARSFGAGRGWVGAEAEAEMRRTLDDKPERLQSLRILSGGNPRTTTMLYEMFAAGGEDDVQADLHRLLDLMTPLYKARMEALSEQPRKLLAHLMEHWDPVGVKELAASSHIPPTTITPQLARLEKEGLIEKAQLASKAGKRFGYQVAERFFNIWYLMRHGSRRVRQRLGWLIAFMRLWYGKQELTDLAALLARRHAAGELDSQAQLEYSLAVASALGGEEGLGLEWRVFATARQRLEKILPDLFDLAGQDRHFVDADDYLRRLEALKTKLRQCPHPQNEEEMERWVEGVAGCIGLSLEDKEAIAERTAGAPPEEMASPTIHEAQTTPYASPDPSFETKISVCSVPDEGTTGVSRSHYQAILENVEEDWMWTSPDPFSKKRRNGMPTVQKAVFQGNFFPDLPNSQTAFMQMEHCFGNDPDAYLVALDCFRTNRIFGERTSHPSQQPWKEKAIRKAISLNPDDVYLWTELGVCLVRGQEAEEAFKKAFSLDKSNGYLLLRLADLQALSGKKQEATQNYRGWLNIPGSNPDDPSEAINLVKIHLWLGNRDFATRSLESLVQTCMTRQRTSFFQENLSLHCHGFGLGPALADLMTESPHADFLQPFILALRAAASGQPPVGAAPEVLALAEEVLKRLHR